MDEAAQSVLFSCQVKVAVKISTKKGGELTPKAFRTLTWTKRSKEINGDVSDTANGYRGCFDAFGSGWDFNGNFNLTTQ